MLKPCTWVNRDLKQRQRWRQREHHKTISLMSKNSHSARALYVLVHFFAAISKTTTWNDHIQGFVENMNTRQWIFHSPSLLERCSYQFSSQILQPHCTNWTDWNNREVVLVTWTYFQVTYSSLLPSSLLKLAAIWPKTCCSRGFEVFMSSFHNLKPFFL